MKNSTIYPNRKVRIALSAIVALYLVVQEWLLEDIVALYSPMFYVGFLVSFLLIQMLLNAVHYITIELDNQYEWLLFPVRRGFLQIIQCYILPLSVYIILMGAYFYFIAECDIFESGFITYGLPAILFCMLIFNLYYVFIYFKNWKVTHNTRRQ